MKELFGTDFRKYSDQDISSINAAVHYEILLHKMYVVWNFAFMFAGVIFVYINTGWLTTNEMLVFLGAFWGVSGLPFFLIRDRAKRKFASSLPGVSPPSAPVTLLKMLTGFALGSWATHVMLIAAVVKIFELTNYSRKLAEA